MGVISLNAVKPGMTLAQDVRDRNGRLLIRVGNPLTDGHVRILKIWGVVEIDVVGFDRDEIESVRSAGIDPKILAAAEAQVADLFRHNDPKLPAVAELMRFCTLRKAQELQAQGVNQGAATDMAADLARQQDALSATVVASPGQPIDPLRFLTEDTTFGSLPLVFHKLLEVINDPRSSATDVAEVISKDTDLSVRLLRIVNSAFYGIRSKIDTISRAVTIIGSNQLLSLAMGVTVINFFRGIPNTLANMDSFWRHSVSCGIAARLIASYHRTPNTERFFVTGLLHDIGRLLIFKELPAYGQAVLLTARARKSLLPPVEEKILGFTHHKLGGILLKHWKFPVSLEKNVRYHHEPHKAVNKNEAAVILLADLLAHALGHGSSGEIYAPRLSASTWDGLGLPLSFLAQTAIQVDYQLDEILKFFMTDD
jgi:HD-like signal output (HDOD) protein